VIENTGIAGVCLRSKTERTMQSHGNLPSRGAVSGADKRLHTRAAIHVPIECRAAGRVVVATAENVGIGGILVRTKETFSWDDVITVSFQLPDSPERFNLEARVAHLVPDLFMGLEFVNCSPDIRSCIQAYVAAKHTAPAAND
jgi:hypothetical protein